MEGKTMKRFFRKQLPAILLALTMMVSLVPAAMAEDCPDGKHKWDSGTVTVEPTCTTSGVKTYHCTVDGCTATKTESVATTDHDYQVDSSRSVPATCQQEGKTVYVCSKCGDTKETTIPKADHKWGSWETEIAATCTSKGSEIRSCEICNIIERREIPMASHTYSDTGKVTTQPTCTTAGVRTFTCSVCNNTVTESIPALGHTDSNKDGKCDRCGISMGTYYTASFYYLTSSLDTTSTSKSVAANGYASAPSVSSKITSGGKTYTFAGWTTTYSGSGWYLYKNQSLVNPSNYRITSNTVFYAVYTTGSDSTITYTVAPGGEERFDSNDFGDVYDDAGCSGTLRYVEFTVTNSAYNNFEGTVYCGGKALTRSQLVSSKFYYSSSSYGDYALDDLTLAAEKNADNDTLTLSFTAYGKSDSTEGTLELVVDEKGSSGGSISYKVAAGKEVAFDEEDFNDVFQKEYPSYDIKYVTFSTSDTLSTTEGTVYYDYGYNDEKSFTKSTIDDYKFYYGKNTGSGDYALDDLSFVAGKNASNHTVELSFRAYYSSTRYVDGTLIIEVGSSSSSSITYKVAPGKKVDFNEADFNNVYRKEFSSGTIKWVEFTAPSALTSAGTIYYDYGYSDQKSFSRTTLNSAKFYYGTSSSSGDYALDDLSFVASSSFSTAVELSFRAYYSSSKYVDGTLTLQPDGTAAVSSYIGSIRYATTTGTKVQINANDIARFFKKNCPGYTMQYVTLTGVPSTGSLYYNYYGASKYGTASKLQLTSSNAGSLTFYASPTSTSQYALTELTYVPSGSNYCTAIAFTAYGSSRSVSGAILISVSNSTVAEVYGVTPKNTAVTLPASSIYNAVLSATGSALSSIQLLSLPASAVGTVYVGTGTSTAANTTTQYTYGGTMNQLRFVPATGYTGSVEIPYVALNSSGTAIASGIFSLGVVNSVKKFSDVTTSTWCYKYVAELSDANVISGYKDGSFKPNSTVTYGAALKLIMLAAGYPEQKPTDSNVFSGYLAKARAEGIVTRSNVDLTKPITRLQVAQLATGALKLNTSNLSSVKPFTDTTDASVQALNAAGIVEGYFSNGTSTYKPNNTLTRGQISAIVWRMRNYSK